MPDVVMSNTIPEEHVDTVLNGVIALGGETIIVSWRNTRLSIEIPNRGASEGAKNFVERVNRRIFWKIMQMADTVAKKSAREELVNAIPQAVSDVPEDVIVETTP